MRLLLLLLCLVALTAKTGPKATSTETVGTGGTGSNPTTKSTGTAGHHGPYEQIGSMVKTGKSKFFDLLKRLKQVKNSDQPEAQKNATRKALNGELHTMLGDATFAKYQQVHRTQAQNLKTLKKDTVAPKKSPAVTGVKKAPSAAGAAPKTKKAAGAAPPTSGASPLPTTKKPKKPKPATATPGA